MPDGAKKGITVKVDAALHAEVSAWCHQTITFSLY